MFRIRNKKTDVQRADCKIIAGKIAARTGRSLIIVLLAVFLCATAIAAHRSLLQQGIAEEVLRFHVLANSDSEQDQTVKYLVRDAVLNWISETMDGNSPDRSLAPAEDHTQTETDKTGSSENVVKEMESAPKSGADTAEDSREDVLQFLTDNLAAIEETANAVLKEQGQSYRASAEIAWSYFPDRTYGDCTFPAGWYQALRIRLGDAKGHNWWCLLYPNLCFTDALCAAVDEESREKLENVLTEEQYRSLLNTPGQWKITFRWLW